MVYNKNYKTYIRYIFSFFKGMNVGQGGFFFRKINNDKALTQEQRSITTLLTLNLIVTDYLTSDEKGDFLKLTEKGYAYLQDADVETNNMQFAEVINCYDKGNPSFHTLWLLIGKEDSAPFYLSGSAYFNIINAYARTESVSYQNYIDELRKNGESTSRSIWYKRLFDQIDKANINNFLNELSQKVREVYGNAEAIYSTVDMVDAPIKDTQGLSPKIVCKKIFISYSHDNEEHKNWVAKLTSDLETAGLDVKTDKDIRLGEDTTLFMERSITEADRVLVVLTPKYKEKADKRINGVGYETGIITTELVSDQVSHKFIPIIRKGTKEESYPVYMANRWGANMQDDASYNEMLKLIIDDIKK